MKPTARDLRPTTIGFLAAALVLSFLRPADGATPPPPAPVHAPFPPPPSAAGEPQAAQPTQATSPSMAIEGTASGASAKTAPARDRGPDGFAITAQLGYAPSSDAFQIGAGLRLAYALPLRDALAVEVGASGVWYAGTNATVPGVSAEAATATNPAASVTMESLSAFLYGLDIGLHLRAGAFSLKPYLSGGLGRLSDRLCAGSTCTNVTAAQHAFVAPGAALQITAARHFLAGLDFRYIKMAAGSTGLDLATPAFALFAGYQF